MSRREFKNITNGITASFISRNNDVCGYWGIGKLYKHMVVSKSMILEINLVDKTMIPWDKEFAVLINEYSQRLTNLMKNRKVSSNYLVSAKIVLEGYPNDSNVWLGTTAPHRMRCKLIIKDDLNKEYHSETNTWCRAHNPNKEIKSSRKYL